MSKMIQVRNVPDEVHRTLKVRAAQAGMSLSEYLLREVQATAERPTLDEIRERVHSRPGVTLPVPAADIIREMRGPI